MDHIDRTVTADNWITFNCPPKTALVLKALRTQLSQVLQSKLDSPTVALGEASRGLIQAVGQLLMSEIDER